MFNNHIQIGPEFFSKIRNDYADWRYALCREFSQNGIDCGSDHIWITISREGENTRMVVRNDGEPMTQDILVNKLLALGASSKDMLTTCGGFGAAKLLLYYNHIEYQIRTGDLIVNGSGAGYNLDQNTYLAGTESSILIAGDEVNNLVNSWKVLIAQTQWSGTFHLNGTELEGDLRKGAPRRDLGFGQVYTNNSFPGKLIVRVHGIPMFSQWIDCKKCVILELSGRSVDCLTSNRDGLIGSYRSQLSAFISELAVDKRSALREKKQSKYRHYHGQRLQHYKQVNIRELVAADIDNEPENEPVGTPERSPLRGQVNTVVAREDLVQSSLSEEFVVKNETEMQVPSYYLPDSDQFSAYSRKLCRMWGRLLVQLYKTLGESGDFAIGFIFSDDCEAEFENGSYGKVYYLNPSRVVKQNSSQSRSFARRFKLTERYRILSLAVHEYIHGAYSLSYHDEDYSSKFTDVIGVVMGKLKDFQWCFR